jgi:hypothetical protein
MGSDKFWQARASKSVIAASDLESTKVEGRNSGCNRKVKKSLVTCTAQSALLPCGWDDGMAPPPPSWRRLYTVVGVIGTVASLLVASNYEATVVGSSRPFGTIQPKSTIDHRNTRGIPQAFTEEEANEFRSLYDSTSNESVSSPMMNDTAETDQRVVLSALSQLSELASNGSSSTVGDDHHQDMDNVNSDNGTITTTTEQNIMVANETIDAQFMDQDNSTSMGTTVDNSKDLVYMPLSSWEYESIQPSRTCQPPAGTPDYCCLGSLSKTAQVYYAHGPCNHSLSTYEAAEQLALASMPQIENVLVPANTVVVQCDVCRMVDILMQQNWTMAMQGDSVTRQSFFGLECELRRRNM